MWLGGLWRMRAIEGNSCETQQPKIKRALISGEAHGQPKKKIIGTALRLQYMATMPSTPTGWQPPQRGNALCSVSHGSRQTPAAVTRRHGTLARAKASL